MPTDKNKEILSARFYLGETVYEKTLSRIRWLYSEFDNVIVSVSGGKDSTVIFNMTKIVAKELGKLPVNVVFLDQEAEWKATIDCVDKIMRDPEVKPYWLQIPFKLNNSTSHADEWLLCFDPEHEADWIHPHNDISLKENVYGTEFFTDIFDAFIKHEFGSNVVNLTGVRAEESPGRLLGLTNANTYKGETWGRMVDPKNKIYNMHPIYDWSYTDIWKAIYDNEWDYNAIYDGMYTYGVKVQNMRVSSLIHETALRSISYMQELDQETWDRMTKRLSGVNTESKFSTADAVPDELPYMFESWKDYRDYLLDEFYLEVGQYENLSADDKLFFDMYKDPDSLNGVRKTKYKNHFINYDRQYDQEAYFKVGALTIVRNDHYFTLLKNYYSVVMSSTRLENNKRKAAEAEAKEKELSK